MRESLTAEAWQPDTDADLLAAVLAYVSDPDSGWSIYRPAVRA